MLFHLETTILPPKTLFLLWCWLAFIDIYLITNRSVSLGMFIYYIISHPASAKCLNCKLEHFPAVWGANLWSAICWACDWLFVMFRGRQLFHRCFFLTYASTHTPNCHSSTVLRNSSLSGPVCALLPTSTLPCWRSSTVRLPRHVQSKSSCPPLLRMEALSEPCPSTRRRSTSRKWSNAAPTTN